jgi:hypothetical protein
MPLRAINNINKSKNKEPNGDNSSELELFMDDNIVIVAFPSCLWDSIRNAAEKLEITTNEVIGNAVKEYCNRNDL